MSTDKAKTVLKDFSVYTVFTGISKFSILLTLPILTRFMPPETYGVFDLLFLAATSLTLLMIAGQEEAIGRFFFDAENKAGVVKSAIIITAALICLIFAAAFIFAEPIIKFLTGDAVYKDNFRLMLLYAGFTALLSLLRGMGRWLFDKKTFFMLTVYPPLGILALTAVFVAGFGWGLKGAIWAQLIPNAIFAIAGLYMFRSIIFAKIPPTAMKSMLKFGLPLMAAAFITTGFSLLDKQLYTANFGLETLGFYALACKYAMFMAVPAAAFIMAFTPVIYKSYSSPEASAMLQKVTNHYALFFSVWLIVLTAAAKPVITVISTAEYAAHPALFLPVAFSLAIEYFSIITSTGIELSRRTWIRAITRALGVATMLCLAPLLANSLGVFGIAYAVLVGRIISHIAETAVSRRINILEARLWRAYAMLTVGFCLSLLLQRIIY